MYMILNNKIYIDYIIFPLLNDLDLVFNAQNTSNFVEVLLHTGFLVFAVKKKLQVIWHHYMYFSLTTYMYAPKYVFEKL